MVSSRDAISAVAANLAERLPDFKLFQKAAEPSAESEVVGVQSYAEKLKRQVLQVQRGSRYP